MKLTHAHPGESDVIVCKRQGVCYVKGRLQPTRAFGDLYLKRNEFNADPRRGLNIHGKYTPPYITCTPEVTFTERTESDAIVVVGSDGLWDYMSNDDAVQVSHAHTLTGSMT